jgi:hypothetical protein
MNTPTKQDYREAEEYYATLTMKELRRYQAITQAQIPMAHEQRKWDTLTHLQRTDDLVTKAIWVKAFGGVKL